MRCIVCDLCDFVIEDINIEKEQRMYLFVSSITLRDESVSM